MDVVRRPHDVSCCLATAANGRIADDAFRERNEPDLISTARRHVREHQCRVESVIEEREAIDLRAHQPARVEHENEALVLFDLIFARNDFSLARRRTPVDRAILVAAPIFAETLEVALPSPLARGTDTGHDGVNQILHSGTVRIVLDNTAKVGQGPPHDLTFSGLPVQIGTVQAGSRASVTFTAPAPGTYSFVCTIHAAQNQTGKLIVR